MNDFSIYVISNRHSLAKEVMNSLSDFSVKYFDGSDVKSFSQLVNRCVESCPTEIIIICSDKIRPKKEHVIKLLKLINDGYGFVGLYRFAFFGFKKELFRIIGCMDERYVGGGYEDCDLLRRMNEANIAYYESEEVAYIKMISSWSDKICFEYFKKKWKIIDNLTVKRMIVEEKYNYVFGQAQNTNFLDWKHSILCQTSGNFKDVHII